MFPWPRQGMGYFATQLVTPSKSPLDYSTIPFIFGGNLSAKKHIEVAKIIHRDSTQGSRECPAESGPQILESRSPDWALVVAPVRWIKIEPRQEAMAWAKNEQNPLGEGCGNQSDGVEYAKNEWAFPMPIEEGPFGIRRGSRGSAKLGRWALRTTRSKTS